jgi:hypothetical protein
VLDRRNAVEHSVAVMVLDKDGSITDVAWDPNTDDVHLSKPARFVVRPGSWLPLEPAASR